MIIAKILVHNYFSKVEKKRDGSFVRTHQHGPGARKLREVISELEAAKLAAYSDWEVCEKLTSAKSGEFPFQSILSELGDL